MRSKATEPVGEEVYDQVTAQVDTTAYRQLAVPLFYNLVSRAWTAAPSTVRTRLSQRLREQIERNNHDTAE